MKIRHHLSLSMFFAWLLVTTTIAAAQANSAVDALKKWPDKRAQRVIQGILRYNREAVLKAGDSFDRRYRPYLIQITKQPRSGNTEYVKEEVALALAKLGDQDQLQTVFCHLHDKSIFSIEEAANNELPYIGGWFAIQRYLQLATEDAEYYAKGREYSATPGADVVPPQGNPSYWAVQGLSKVIPNPPFPPFKKLYEPPSQELSARVQAWRTWIAAHKATLRKLKPTGDGVDFSANACNATQQKTSKSE